MRNKVGVRDKMIVLAEISDKMASVPMLWGMMAVLAAPFIIGATKRWVAWGLLPVALAFSGSLGYQAYHEAFVESGMKESIRDEMGWWWIINSILSTVLPVLVSVVALFWTIRKRGTP